MSRHAAHTLVAVLALSAATSCDRDDDHHRSPAGPVSQPLELRETATPGERYTIAEVATVEVSMPAELDPAPDLELVHESEIGKHIEVEIVQVGPDARPVRYRKRFVSFRQRNTARLADAPPRTDAEAHPVEGHTLEYVWRRGDEPDTGRWQIRWLDGPGGRAPDAMPDPLPGRDHPWLPTVPVRPGDQWHTSALPLTIPGVTPDQVDVALTLDHVEHTDDGARVAHVVVDGSIQGTDTTGRLEGNYRFQLADRRAGIPGRILRIQLAGRLTQPAPGDVADAPPVTVELVVYRAVE